MRGYPFAAWRLGEGHGWAFRDYPIARGHFQGIYTYQGVAKTKHSVLTELIKNIDVIETEDSLQLLARLPKKEQEGVINQIIQDKIKKEQLALQEERLKQQMQPFHFASCSELLDKLQSTCQPTRR